MRKDHRVKSQLGSEGMEVDEDTKKRINQIWEAIYKHDGEEGELRQMYISTTQRFGKAAMFTALLTGGTLFLTGFAGAAETMSLRDAFLMLGGLAIPIGLLVYWRMAGDRSQSRKEESVSVENRNNLRAFYFMIVLAASIAAITFIVNGLVEFGAIQNGPPAGTAMIGTSLVWFAFAVIVGWKYLRPLLSQV